jgi:plasmid stabilization system protein ParE
MGRIGMTDQYRVIVSPQAFDDLNDILEFIAQHSPANAAAVIDRLLSEIANLALFPGRSVWTRVASVCHSKSDPCPFPPSA